MFLLARIINLLFLIYTIMILIRVIGSWFPAIQGGAFMRFISHFTDPYLNFFRSFIPPLGMIDLSPLVAILALQLAKWLIFFILSRFL